MGLSFWHILLLGLIVLVVFGPSRLPHLGKSMGEAIRGFKKGLNDDEIDVTESTHKEQLHGTEGSSKKPEPTANKEKV